MELLLAALLYFTTTTVPAPGDPVIVLPRVEEPVTRAESLLVISLDAEGDMFLAAEPVTQADLIEQLSAIAAKDRAATRVFLRVHPTLDHNRAMKVMTLLSKEGFSNIALVQGGNGSALEGSMIPQTAK